MKFTAKQIADLLEGEIEGDPNEEISTISKIEEAREGSLTFLANAKYNHYLYTTKASIAIVNKSFQPDREINTTIIKVEDAYLSFSKVLALYNEVKNNKKGRENPCFISNTATIGENEYIGAFSYIGNNVTIGNNVKIYPNSFIGDNVVIGDNTKIYAGVKIYSETLVGKNCVFHSGSVIGSDGFGFKPNDKGEYEDVPHIGNVIIEDNVSIGANTTIDRATLGSTIIRKGVKLDNLIQVGHNVEVGKNTVIASQTGVAGSTKVGEDSIIGGQVGIAGHLKLANKLRIQAQSGISKTFSYTDYFKSYASFRNLPKIVATINKLEKELNTQKTNNE